MEVETQQTIPAIKFATFPEITVIFLLLQETRSRAHVTMSNNEEKQRHTFSGEALGATKGVPGGVLGYRMPLGTPGRGSRDGSRGRGDVL